MKSVHEPSPNGDSETVLTRKPGKKLSQVHDHPTGPTGTPRCAQERPSGHMCAVSWPGPQPCRGKGPAVTQALVAVSQPPLARPCAVPRAMPRVYALSCRAPRLSYRGPSGRVVGAGCAPARPYRRPSAVRLLAVSWASCVVLQHSPAFPP